MTYEQIIKSAVEGQVKSFIDGHPGLLDCITWFKPRNDNEGKKQTFINSVSKRIIAELTSVDTKMRIGIALMDGLLSEQQGTISSPVPGEGSGGTSTVAPNSPRWVNDDKNIGTISYRIGDLWLGEVNRLWTNRWRAFIINGPDGDGPIIIDQFFDKRIEAKAAVEEEIEKRYKIKAVKEAQATQA